MKSSPFDPLYYAPYAAYTGYKMVKYLRGSQRSIRKPLGVSTYGNALDLAKIQRRLNTLLPERKYYDVAFSLASVAGNSVNSIHITSVAQGTESFERIGNHIHVHKVEWRGWGNTSAEMFIVSPKESTSPPGTTDFVPSGSRVFPKCTELVTFKRRRHTLSGNPNGFVTNLNFKRPLKIDYNGILGTSVIKNPLYAVVIPHSSGATGSYDGAIRVWYTDI